MNERERIISAIKHEETDFTPYNIQFTVEQRQKMADFYGDPGFESKIGNHIDLIDVRPPKAEIRPGFVRDEFGVVLDKTIDKDFGVVEEYLVDAANVDSFGFPDPNDPAFYEGLRMYRASGKFCVAKFSHVFFERAWMLYGMEDLMADMLLQPQAIGRLMDRILEYFLTLLKNISAFDFVDCVYYGDDWGQQYGLIMGPDMWRKFIKPRLKILFGAAKEMGKYVYIHTCGDIVGILPDIIELGVDIYDPFQPEAFDVFGLKKQYGRDITFLGGVSLQKVLPFGSVEDVRNEVRLKLKELGEGGGYICAPSHTVTKDVPAENLDEMIKILRNQ